MNNKIARFILDIENSELLTLDILKRKYRIKALLYHPDKNNSPDSCERFQEIQCAYEYLLKTVDNNENFIYDHSSYKDILMDFLRNTIDGNLDINEFQSRIFKTIIQKITQMCEKKAVNMLNKIDKDLLIKIYDILKKYKDIFYISENLLSEINTIVGDKIKNDECIILNPLLDDLFEHNLYKLKIDERIYLIPLWHHELIYDNSGSDLYVKCCPILPENVQIDNKNNIFIDLKYKIDELFGKEEITIEYGKKEFYFCPSDLKLTKTQSVVLKNQGISIIQSDNIYDITKKGNIILNIELEI